MFVWLCRWARQLSRNVSVDAGFLCGRAAVLRDRIKGTTCGFCSPLERNLQNKKVNMKGKVRRRTDHECSEGEKRYSSTLSLTSALGGGGGLSPRYDCFITRKETRCPSYRRLGGPHGRSGRVWKMPPPGFDPCVVQSVASRYTDWAILAPVTCWTCVIRVRVENRSCKQKWNIFCIQ